MPSPNSHQRHATVARSVTAGGVALDLYPAPHGSGWWTPADPILAAAGIPEAEQADFLRRHGMTKPIGGFEIVWDGLKPEWRQSVALLSRHAVAGVLAHAVAAIDPATVATIDAALAG